MATSIWLVCDVSWLEEGRKVEIQHLVDRIAERHRCREKSWQLRDPRVHHVQEPNSRIFRRIHRPGYWSAVFWWKFCRESADIPDIFVNWIQRERVDDQNITGSSREDVHDQIGPLNPKAKLQAQACHGQLRKFWVEYDKNSRRLRSKIKAAALQAYDQVYKHGGQNLQWAPGCQKIKEANFDELRRGASADSAD